MIQDGIPGVSIPLSPDGASEEPPAPDGAKGNVQAPEQDAL
jgi:hypothetical protein